METLRLVLETPVFTLGEFLAAVFALCYVSPRVLEWAAGRMR